MLVLSRKTDEKLLLNITPERLRAVLDKMTEAGCQPTDVVGIGAITVVAIQGNRTKLGIDIPRDFEIVRNELVTADNQPVLTLS